MALNISKCNHLAPLHFKGLNCMSYELQTLCAAISFTHYLYLCLRGRADEAAQCCGHCPMCIPSMTKRQENLLVALANQRRVDICLILQSPQHAFPLQSVEEPYEVMGTAFPKRWYQVSYYGVSNHHMEIAFPWEVVWGFLFSTCCQFRQQNANLIKKGL